MIHIHAIIICQEADQLHDEGVVDHEASDEEDRYQEDKKSSLARESSLRNSFRSVPERSAEVADKYEAINIEGQQETGIWVHHPGSEVSQTWEPRKGKARHLERQTTGEGIDPLRSPSSIASGSVHNDGSSTDENSEGKRSQAMNTVRKGLEKIGSVFHRNRKEDNFGNISDVVPSPPSNLREVHSKGIGVRFIVEDNLSKPSEVPKEDSSPGQEGSGPESPNTGNVKGMAKSILKQAGKSARGIKHALSRKGSRKSKVDRENRESDSSDEDSSVSSSACTPTKEGIPIISIPASSHGNDPADHKERVIFIDGPASGIKEPASEMKVQDKGNSDALAEQGFSSEASVGKLERAKIENPNVAT